MELNKHYFRIPFKMAGRQRVFTLGALSSYSDKVINLIVHALKYDGFYLLAYPLAKLMADYLNFSGLRNIITPESVITPVPLHPSRLKMRGYNQSEIIGEELGKNLEVPALLLLRRKRKTKEQAVILTEEDRRKNVRGCFEVVAGRKNEIAGRQILLIDDVFTSGATMLEAAKVLYQNGAREVIGLTVAKA
ncbi:MAG: ComF family protein [Patescibacteria group bacterium]|nr:ComF family protein [Patescibacteria group bacterium]